MQLSSSIVVSLFTWVLLMLTVYYPLKNKSIPYAIGGGGTERTALRRRRSFLREADPGWSPTSYPDPARDPEGCGISDIPHDPSHALPMLCDPDRMLEPTWLVEISQALSDFSEGVYYHESPCDVAEVPLTIPLNLPLTIPLTPVRMSVAIVNKMNLQAVLRTNSYYSYEDQEDAVVDAAQYFARYLHDAWAVGSAECGRTGILIFMSVRDGLCFVSTGRALTAVLPWWRLERVVTEAAPVIRDGKYGEAIRQIIDRIGYLLQAGPPSVTERALDFLQRFGVVISFALLTFIFTAWGEYRDRRQRFKFTEQRSQLSIKETQVARLLQHEYKCYSCAICLETFETHAIDDPSLSPLLEDQVPPKICLPTEGSDGQPLKLLRCGHAFDQSCWECWVNSGHGDPCKCPVCRQDVGGAIQIHSPTVPPINEQNYHSVSMFRIWEMSHNYGSFAVRRN